MKRIGEILVANGWVEVAVLDRALAKQREIPRRLCSLLIAGGVLEVDEASRALGEQHGVPAVLQKHLDHRDHALAQLIPAELARAWWVLPIGRMGTGELIVCARDPQPNVLAALAAVIEGPLILAVAPASRIETLVGETYGLPDHEFDVDLSTGPVATLDLEPMADEDDPMAGLGNLTLVELDADGVTRDPTQSGMIQVGPQRAAALPPSSAGIKVPTLPPQSVPIAAPTPPVLSEPPRPAARAESPAIIVDAPPAPQPGTPPTMMAPPSRVDPAVLARAYAIAPPKFDPSTIAVGTERPSRKFVTLPTSLSETFTALAAARTQDEVSAVAMSFAASRWRAALLLAVKEKTALGECGHGHLLTEEVVEGLAIPLGVESIVTLALQACALTTTPPDDATPVQARLDRLLGMPRFPAAIPISIGGRAAFVLLIGDPTTDDPDTATIDLGRLADALATAYTRVVPM